LKRKRKTIEDSAFGGGKKERGSGKKEP